MLDHLVELGRHLEEEQRVWLQWESKEVASSLLERECQKKCRGREEVQKDQHLNFHLQWDLVKVPLPKTKKYKRVHQKE